MKMVSWTAIIIFSLLILIVLGAIAVWIIIKIIFKHKVRVIDLGKQSIELDYKAREIIRDGVRYWQLDKGNKEQKNMPVPPAEAIHIAKRGKKSVEAIRTETGEYIFLKRNINLAASEKLKKDLAEIERKAANIEDKKEREELIAKYKDALMQKWSEENEGMVIKAYEPFTTKQRMILMNNFIKAQSRKGFSLREQLPTLISIGALVILVVSLMIFWGDIANPVLEARNIGVREQELLNENLKILQDIQRGQQRIEATQQQIMEGENNG